MLIKNCRFVVTPQTVLENSDILIAGDRIAQVGKNLKKENGDGMEIEGSKRLAMPGLINTHTHAAMALFRGAGDDMELMKWLSSRIWPMEAKLAAEDVYAGGMLAALEMVKSGTTTFCDMYYCMDEMARVCREIGIRGYLSYAIINREISKEPGDPVGNCKKFIKRYQKDPLVFPVAGPHAIYTNSEDSLRRVAELCRETKTLAHIHLSETKGEVENCIKHTGKRPAQYLDSLGFFDVPALAAHCIWLDPAEISLLSKKNVSIAHNPVSNMKLASGIMPLKKIQQARVNISLGTDGAASNNSLDMFETVKITALLHKVTDMDAEATKAAGILKMATANGGKALNSPLLGKIEKGCAADVILLDNMSPKMIKEAVGLIKGKALIEVSGGVTLENIREIAETGVDFISVGLLTHSPEALDIGLYVV